MKLRIIHRNRTLGPIDKSQVFYLEPAFDQRTNKYIVNNFDKIKALFRSYDLDFIYEPITRKELVQYHAPQLSCYRQQKDNSWQRYCDELINCPIDGEGAVDGPSLMVYGGFKHNFEFLCIPINKHWYNSYDYIFHKACRRIAKAEKAKRRYYHDHFDANEIFPNGCNVEQYLAIDNYRPKPDHIEALITEPIQPDNHKDKPDLFEAHITEPIQPDNHKDKPDDIDDCDYSRKTWKGPVKGRYANDSFDWKPDKIEDYSVRTRPIKGRDADENFDRESEKIVEEIKSRIYALQNKGINTMFLHQIIDDAVPLSRMVITKDYRIFLPDYNNMEITMASLPKSIYFLFLRHPEGIRFKELPDYRSELLNIYRKVGAIGSDTKQRRSIERATNPTLNTINENCARIREAFVSKFDEQIARNYFITGERGEPKCVLLDSSKIEWE